MREKELEFIIISVIVLVAYIWAAKNVSQYPKITRDWMAHQAKNRLATRGISFIIPIGFYWFGWIPTLLLLLKYGFPWWAILIGTMETWLLGIAGIPGLFEATLRIYQRENSVAVCAVRCAGCYYQADMFVRAENPFIPHEAKLDYVACPRCGERRLKWWTPP